MHPCGTGGFPSMRLSDHPGRSSRHPLALFGTLRDETRASVVAGVVSRQLRGAAKAGMGA